MLDGYVTDDLNSNTLASATGEDGMETDRYGLGLTTTSTIAASHYRDGVDLMLAAWPGVTECLEAAIAADPRFALAQLARGRVHQMYAEMAPAREKAALARDLAKSCKAREQGHIEVIASAIEGQSARAITAAESHLEDHPRDALALSTLLGAFGLYAFSGRADHDAARVAICERHARHYGRDWWFMSYLGWSHTEAGNPGAGRLLCERSLEIRRANANAAHALSHALFEQGELDACQAFMDDWLPGYDRAGILNAHLCWHVALGLLDKGDTAGALRIHDERIALGVSQATPLNAFTDVASLLWRAELSGAPRRAAAWTEVAEYASRQFPKAGLAFSDMHHALIAAATGNSATAQSRLAEIEALRSAGKFAAGQVIADMTRGLLAFGAGDYAGAIAALQKVQSETVRIGGSHAQRELVEDTLIVAWLRGGEPAKARSLIDHRLHRRPSQRDVAWRQLTTAA